MEEYPNNKIWNRTLLKYLAILAMVIDHVGMMFIPITTVPGILCRVIGRLTAPVMCLFLAEGFYYTSSRKKYGIRLFIFALLSQAPYALMHKDTLLTIDLNVIYTLFCSFVMLCLYERFADSNLRWLLVGAAIGASTLGDWGIFGPLFVLAFYVYRNNRKWQLRCFIAISSGMVVLSTAFCIANDYHWYGELWQLGLFLFIPVLFLYNGKTGSRAPFHKWFFYVFYPLHMLIFWMIKWKL